jgi:hypothetical protein
MGMKLEVVVVPVSDVEKSVTPPGSSASVIFGTSGTAQAPGLHLIVNDIGVAHDDLKRHGADPSEVFHDAGGVFHHGGFDARVPGPDPGRGSYGSFLSFSDPDGNGWLLQEITTRLPGRPDPSVTTYASTADLAAGLRRAAAAHGEHEKRIGAEDPDWPDWYADYMVREQAGTELPS